MSSCQDRFSDFCLASAGKGVIEDEQAFENACSMESLSNRSRSPGYSVMSRQCLRVTTDWLSECSEGCFLADTSQPCMRIGVPLHSFHADVRKYTRPACECL